MLVCYSVTASPAQTIGPVTLILCIIVGRHVRLLIFYSSRSKVKGQGQKMMFSASTIGALKIAWLNLFPGWIIIVYVNFFTSVSKVQV